MNSFATIPSGILDVFDDTEHGYPASVAAEDDAASLMMAAGEIGRTFPQSMWIEPRDWPDRCRYNDEKGLWPINYLTRYTNQTPTHECTTHSLRALFEGARNRARHYALGPPQKNVRLAIPRDAGNVYVSPVSIYCEANPGQWGGASIRGVMEIAVKRGFLPEPNNVQPYDYGFKHTMIGTCGKGGVNQASGDWPGWRNGDFIRSPGPNWRETAAWFRPLEIVFPASLEEMICCLLNGWGVGVGRNGHAVPYMFFNIAEWAAGYVDSYDRVLFDSKRTMQGCVGTCFAICSVVQPDDWLQPVGGLAL